MTLRCVFKPAAEQRKKVAPGVSPGLDSPPLSPVPDPPMTPPAKSKFLSEAFHEKWAGQSGVL